MLFGGRELLLLQLVDVSKAYPGGVRALSGVTLDIPPGMFGLLGPNGAGKSTLMRTIATLQAPDSGAITFDGIDVLRDKTALRKVLGYLPQEFGSYPRTSALAMLGHLAALKGCTGTTGRRRSAAWCTNLGRAPARIESFRRHEAAVRHRQALLETPGCSSSTADCRTGSGRAAALPETCSPRSAKASSSCPPTSSSRRLPRVAMWGGKICGRAAGALTAAPAGLWTTLATPAPGR